MHVLITGHTGYIGPVAIRMFKNAGHKVTGLDVGYFSECLVEQPELIAPDFEINRDIREVSGADLKGIDAIVHLAALSNDPLGKLNPAITHAINFGASMNFARIAKNVGVSRFVFASSCSIYGAAGHEGKLTEESPFSPVSAYALSKVQMEAALSALADQTFSPVYLRNATAFGVSPRIRLDLVLNNLVAWAVTTGKIKVLSDGTPWRPLVHIEDICLAALCAVEAERDVIHNEPFNIGRSDCNYQVKDIAEMVSHVVPDAKIETTGEAGGDPRSYQVDFSKSFSKLPGFTPKWDLERGCYELVNWFNLGIVQSEVEIESRRFNRLKQLQYLMENSRIDSNLRVLN